MTFVFVPKTTQVVVMRLLEQAMLLLAAVALDPAVTLTLEMSVDK
jgi:hypothetical protein